METAKWWFLNSCPLHTWCEEHAEDRQSGTGLPTDFRGMKQGHPGHCTDATGGKARPKLKATSVICKGTGGTHFRVGVIRLRLSSVTGVQRQLLTTGTRMNITENKILFMDTWIGISYHFHISQIFQVFQPLKIVKAILKIKGHTKMHELGPRTSWLTQRGELGTRGTEIGKPRELAIGLMRSGSLGHWKCKYVL